MTPKETKAEHSIALSILRDELTGVARSIVEEADATSPEKDRFEKIRKEAVHLMRLLDEHLTEERIKVLDVVQPLWVPDGEDQEPGATVSHNQVDPLAGTIMVVDDDPSLSDPLIQQLRELEQRTFEALVKSQKQLADELAEAAEYVTSLLPEKLTSPVATDWRYIPSSQLGGDSFGYHWVDNDHLAFYLLDVCGHGVGAALLSVSVLNFLRSGALPGQEARDPALVLGRLNSTFPMEGHNDMYFSVWYGVYNARSSELDYCSGGHPPALLCSPGEPVKTLSSGGTVIGALNYSQYRTGRVTIPSGSQLYLFSDGAYEIGRPGAEMMTHQEFTELVGGMQGPERLTAILSMIRKQHGSMEFDDDFSLMEFRFSEATPALPSSLNLRNNMGELTRLLRFTEEFSTTHGISKEDLIDVDVILEEMVTNVFKYGGIPLETEACLIQMRLRGASMEIMIEDKGKPFNPLLLPEVDTAKGIEDRPIGGLGIHFV